MKKNEKKQNDQKKKHKLSPVVVIVCVLLLFAAFGNSTTETSDTQQEQLKTENTSTAPTSETISVESNIELIAGEQGEYGELITMSEGTDLEENFYVYYVPSGKYEVTNIGEYMTQVNVYEGIFLNEETGYDEYTNTGDIILLDVGATDTIEVPEGWFIEIQEPTHISLTATN